MGHVLTHPALASLTTKVQKKVALYTQQELHHQLVAGLVLTSCKRWDFQFEHFYLLCLLHTDVFSQFVLPCIEAELLSGCVLWGRLLFALILKGILQHISQHWYTKPYVMITKKKHSFRDSSYHLTRCVSAVLCNWNFAGVGWESMLSAEILVQRCEHKAQLYVQIVK